MVQCLDWAAPTVASPRDRDDGTVAVVGGDTKVPAPETVACRVKQTPTADRTSRCLPERRTSCPHRRDRGWTLTAALLTGGLGSHPRPSAGDERTDIPRETAQLTEAGGDASFSQQQSEHEDL